MLRVQPYAPYLIILFASLQVLLGPFQPAKAIFIGIDVLLSVRMQRHFFDLAFTISLHIRQLLASVKAMKHLASSLNV